MKTEKFWQTLKMIWIKTYYYQLQKNYNRSQNTLEHLYMLIQFPFNLNETEPDHYHYKLDA